MSRMSNEKRPLGKWRYEKKHASLQSWMERLKKGRGAKRRSPSPPPPAPLSFFKVMIGNFRDVLFIPPMVACNLKGLVKKYIRIEDSDANSWSVKLSIVDCSLAFQNGWHDFVTDHSITAGEFLMFTYNGGLLFTARVFGTSSLERVNFQLRKRSYWCIKQRSNAELGSDNARIPKRQKTLKTSKDRHSSHTSENIHLLKEIEVDPSDFPKANANESDSVFEEVREDSSFGWKFPHQISNTKKPNEGLKLDSLLTWCVNSDPKIAKELDVVSDTDIVMLDGRNHEAFVNESITNSATSEQRTVCLIGDGTPEPEITGKPWSMTNFAPSWEINEHVENKKRSAEMNDCQIPDGEIDCRMKINRTMEKKHSNSPELPSAESLEEMMATECNLKHEKDSPKMEVNLTEPEGIACEVLHAAGLFHTFNEKSTKQVIPSDPSTDILRFTEDVKKDVMPTVERYEEHQSKGESVKQEAFTNEDAKDVTPSSGWRSPIEMERTDLIEIPASGCASFTVCILDDVQPSLELPENLASHIGKLKHERKVFVLQDPSFKCWPVLYLESLDYVGFIGGWIDFAIGNNICKGDICKFELIDKKKLLFRVQIRKE